MTQPRTQVASVVFYTVDSAYASARRGKISSKASKPSGKHRLLPPITRAQLGAPFARNETKYAWASIRRLGTGVFIYLNNKQKLIKSALFDRKVHAWIRVNDAAAPNAGR